MNCWGIICCLPPEISSSVVLSNVSLADLAQLDSACCSRKARKDLLSLMKRLEPVILNKVGRVSRAALFWLSKRTVRLRHANIHGYDPEVVALVQRHSTLFYSIGIIRETKPLAQIVETDDIFVDKITCFDDGSSNERYCNPGRLRNLTSLAIYIHQDSVDWIAELLHSNERLATLKVTYTTSLSDTFFSALGSRSSSLTALTVIAPRSFWADSLTRISQSCPGLQQLQLESYINAYGFDFPHQSLSDGVLSLARGCPDLRALVLPDAHPSALALRALMRGCPRLSTLHLKNLRVNDALMLVIAPQQEQEGGRVGWMPHLQDLSAVWTVLSFDAVEQCERTLAHLRCLHLQCVYSSYEPEVLVSALGCMGQLRELRIVGESGVILSHRALITLGRGCSELRLLSLSCAMEPHVVEGALIHLVSGCVYLESLHLLHHSAKLTDAVLDALPERAPAPAPAGMGVSGGGARGLRSLRCAAARVTDAGMTTLALRSPQMEELVLPCATSLTDASLAALTTHCSFLRELRLKDSLRLTPAGVAAFCGASRHLRTLYVPGRVLTAMQASAIKLETLSRHRKLVFCLT